MKRFAIQGAYLILSPHEILKDKYLIIEGTKISDITDKLPKDITEVLGGPHDIVMPGLINTHTHAAMSLFRGFADDLPLMTWLNEKIFPAEAKFVDEEFVYMGTLLAAWEMVRSGTTAFCDGYFFEDHVAKAAKEVGIRVWLGEGILDFPTPYIKDPSTTIEAVRAHIERWKNDQLVKTTVFPHATYTCAPKLLQKAYALAEEYDLIYQIHLSETAGEVSQVKEKHYKSPVEHLDSLGCLSERTLAAHCVALSEHDIEILAKRGVSVAHNAESNMKLASGIAPIPEMLEAGINISIGTDGCASNNNLDMIGEISTVAKLHKVAKMDATVIDAPTALSFATINGAKALRFDGGTLHKGAPADVVVLDGSAPNMVPVHNPVSSVVYSANGPNVKDVVINGKVIVKNAKATTIDEEAMLKEWRKIEKKLNHSLI
jgi:5-methylthioadenosine/S-adenosylhomocysteine deaminase